MIWRRSNRIEVEFVCGNGGRILINDKKPEATRNILVVISITTDNITIKIIIINSTSINSTTTSRNNNNYYDFYTPTFQSSVCVSVSQRYSVLL